MLFLWGLPVHYLLHAALIAVTGVCDASRCRNALPDAAHDFHDVAVHRHLRWDCSRCLRASQNGALFVLYLMLLVWCGDIAAYYVGRAIGNHKLAPRVSPGKSWEGAIASVVGRGDCGRAAFPLHRADRRCPPLCASALARRQSESPSHACSHLAGLRCSPYR